MSRALLILASPGIRRRAKEWIDRAPANTRVEFREAKRSTEQNDKMWAALTDVSKQVLHFGRRYPPDVWKILMMAAMGQEVKFVPALDGTSVVPLGYRSSELSVAEMSELIEFIIAEGTKRGVIFNDPETKRGAAGHDADGPTEAGTNPPTLQQATRATRATKEPVS
jgi:hypothetical protein